MRIHIGETRLAWVLLLALTGLSLLAGPPLGRLSWTLLVIAFLPGTVVLCIPARAATIAADLERLLAGVLGRFSVLLALASLVMLGLVFDASLALTLVGLVSSVTWTLGCIFPLVTVDRAMPRLTIAGGILLLGLGLVDVIFNSDPIARQLGTPSEEGKWETRYDQLQRHNIFRFRSHYEDTRRRKGVRRILAIGDSFTGGSHVASADSVWPALLERRLAANASGPPTEVINAGVGGYTAANEAELLRRVGWQFSPDLVIWQFLVNDALPSHPDFGSVGRGEIEFPLDRFRNGLIHRSAIVDLLERGLSSWLHPLIPLHESLYQPGQIGWAQLRAALREVGDSAAARCTPVVYVLFPYFVPGTWTAETYPLRDIHQKVAAAASSAGLVALDLTDAFARQGGDWRRWWATPYNSHPNAAAYHVAANAIGQFIEERHLLPDSATGGQCGPGRGDRSSDPPDDHHQDSGSG